MPLVYFKVDDPSGEAKVDTPVYAILIGPTLTNVSVSERTTSTRTDAWGNWQLELRSNDLYATSGSYYQISVGGSDTFHIQVPNTAQSFPLSQLVGTGISTSPIPLVVGEQIFTEEQKQVVRSNLGLGDIATHSVAEFALKSQSLYVVQQEGASYPVPPPGYAVYRYIGTVDPSSDSSLPLTPGSDWVNLNVTP